ncbi:MAG: hypothetical protein OXK79_11830, partial [Chloroflexota bacterium]|nr:hypothetical protein [Chloroflexota bacterium]
TGQSGPIDDDEAVVLERRSRENFSDKGDLDLVDGGRWWTDVKEHLMGSIGEAASGALGHAGVATWPDKPFLVWTAVFEHEVPAREVRQHRDNPKTFLEGCRALHKMFCKVGREAPHLRERVPTRFGDIEERVQGILATVGDKGVRSDAWKEAAMDGAFAVDPEEIPPYAGHEWLETLEGWRERQGTDRAVRSQEVVESDTFRFYQAAAIHRTFVLRDLLPTHGLAVN